QLQIAIPEICEREVLLRCVVRRTILHRRPAQVIDDQTNARIALQRRLELLKSFAVPMYVGGDRDAELARALPRRKGHRIIDREPGFLDGAPAREDAHA